MPEVIEIMSQRSDFSSIYTTHITKMYRSVPCSMHDFNKSLLYYFQLQHMTLFGFMTTKIYLIKVILSNSSAKKTIALDKICIILIIFMYIKAEIKLIGIHITIRCPIRKQTSCKLYFFI